MLKYLKKTAILLGIGALLAKPVYTASQNDIDRLVAKLKNQGKYERVIYEGTDEWGDWSKKGESWFKKLKEVTLEEKTYDYISVLYFIGEDGRKQLAFHMFIGTPEHLFIHSVSDGGKLGYESGYELEELSRNPKYYELDGKLDVVSKEDLTEGEQLKLINDFKNNKLKRYSDKNTKPDKQSERLYDKVIEKFLQLL